MEKDLQADTETLMQICADTLVRNYACGEYKDLWSRLIFISSKAILVEAGMKT